MEYIHYALDFLSILFIYIVIIKIYMVIANYIGEKLGLGKFFMNLWEKMRKNK